VLEADSGDLRVEGEVAACVAREHAFGEEPCEARTRREDPHRRARREPIERCYGFLERRGPSEDPGVGDHPNEFAKAEDGEPPRHVAFGERGEARQRGGVMLALAPMAVDENVGIDGDQRRPSITS